MLDKLYNVVCKLFSLCLIDGPSKDPKEVGDFIGDVQTELPDISYQGWTEEFPKDIDVDNLLKIRCKKS